LARGRKKGNTGKRYSEDQKREILAFVANQGRGGITAAGRKYGVSYIALRRWMNGTGGAGGRKTARGAASKALDGRKLKSVTAALSALKSFKKQVTLLQRALKQLAR
jgi:transposase-like protein